MDEFYTNLVDIFEVDEVNPDSVLRDFENWDSLTVLSVLAMADATYGVVLSADNLLSITTAGELANFIAANRLK